ncbi:PREDICTED: coiled-coil domain-containing protein 96-like [Rhagoletis zephyria]|uniref:coiled-coil domain-containing protein 96-like n=1 Tax=Rhagoletis zephyria TaxID=28612 RepID=UPI0008118A5B|nr:PREDICTED: coiled-coil domain-containing protein 96-like [Rhagoletis zephyria]
MEEETYRVRINIDGENEKKNIDSRAGIPIIKTSLKTTKPAEVINVESGIEAEASLNADEAEATQIRTVIEVLDEELLSSDSEASLTMRPTYLEQGELEESLDFFEQLGSIPNIGSLEEKIHKKASAKSADTMVANEVDDGRDIGRFVDPLTGELLSSTSEEEEQEKEEVTEEEEESSKSEDIDFSEDEELLELLKADQEIEAPKPLDDTEVFETFLEMEKDRVVVDVVEFDWVAYERKKELNNIATDTLVFLKELIKHAVDKVEYVDPKVLLRQNLDKAALIAEIVQKLAELEAEQKSRTYLNRRVVEYFYRKGQYRVFTEDPPDTINYEMERFKEATTKLDLMLAREQEVKRISERKLADLQQAESEWQIKNQEIWQELEEVVRKTFAHKGDRLSLAVDSQLRTMGKLRDEISAVRYILIQKQHSSAAMTEQIKQLEDLGNNLQMRDYESLQNEVQALGKKIEERNADLNKSRMRCNTDIHIMGHLKEKQATLRSKIKLQNTMLASLQKEKQAAREAIFNSKKQRTKIRKEIKELSYQCGLLDKPALMLDYDATVAQLKVVGENVEKLRCKQDEIQRKIAKLESKCL